MVERAPVVKLSRVVVLAAAVVACLAGPVLAQVGIITADSPGIHGVVGISADQFGVYGSSIGASTADNGVYGRTESTNSPSEAGVYGFNSGTGPGVYGYGNAVDTGYGVRGFSVNSHGVYGEAFGNTTTAVYGGFFTGPKGVYGAASYEAGDAVYGNCTGTSACWGLRGYSVASYAIYGDTGNTSHNYGLYTTDNIYSLNYHALGGLSLIVQNVPDTVIGATSLEPGEVVALSGIAAAPPGADLPVAQVTRADWTATGGLVGVVETAYEITMVKRPEATFVKKIIPDSEGGEPDSLWVPAPQEEQEEHKVAIHRAVDGPVPPGGYAVVRVLGLAQVKVAALNGPILAGDALRVTSLGGAAVLGNQMDMEDAPVVARALEPLPAGDSGLVWAIVGMR